MHELVFEGLDTVATVALNGDVVARGREPAPHLPLRRDRPAARGREHLVVAFRSPMRYADAQSVVLGARPRPYPTPFDAIRKSACSFGWDWGIATATSGIWRPVRLESWSTARLEEVLVRASPAGDGRRRRGGRHGEASGCRGRGRSRRAEPGSRGRRARAPRRSIPAGSERGHRATRTRRGATAGGPSATATPSLYDVARAARRRRPGARRDDPTRWASATCAGTPSPTPTAPRSSSS